MYTTLRRNDPEQLPRGVAEALAVAEIPTSKLGPSRRARLSDPQRELYFWIMRRFAADGRPNRAEASAAAGRLGVDGEDALAVFAREDLVHLGRDGEIAVAYPFSGRPTAHRVHFRSGHAIHAMCAIDALGIAPMFDEPIQIAYMIRSRASRFACSSRATETQRGSRSLRS
jgi:hypothetical protein